MHALNRRARLMIMTLRYPNLDGWSHLVARTMPYTNATWPSTFDRHED